MSGSTAIPDPSQETEDPMGSQQGIESSERLSSAKSITYIPTDIKEPATAEPEDLNNAIHSATRYYHELQRDPQYIWECIIDDFAHWSQGDLERANRNAIRSLRDTFRAKGIYTRREARFPVAEAIMEVVNADNLPQWPGDDVENPGGPSSSPSQPEHPLSATTISSAAGDGGTLPAIEGATHPLEEDRFGKTPSSSTRQRLPSPPPTLASPTASMDLLRRLDILGRSYHETEKFSGRQYDFLRTKVNLFADKCQRAEFPEGELARAVPIMLTGPAYEHYVNNLANKRMSYKAIIAALKARYETEATMSRYQEEWRTLDLNTVIAKNPDKNLSSCLEILTEQIQKLHQGLFRPDDEGFNTMRERLRAAASRTPACSFALMKPGKTFEDLAAELQQAIAIYEQMKPQTPQQPEMFYVDRYFRRSGRPPNNYHDRGRFQSRQKRCYVCRKPGCWSTKHPDHERSQARNEWNQKSHPMPPTTKKYQAFLAAYEGTEPDDEDGLLEALYNTNFLHEDEDASDEDNELEPASGISMFAATGTFTQNFMAIAVIPPPEEILARLHDQSFRHAILHEDPYSIARNPPAGAVFASEERYSDHTFRGIMPDTGAAGTSNAGLPQVRALMTLIPSLKIEDAPKTTIHFGAGSASSIGIIRVPTAFGTIAFQVLPTTTPFLYSITDMDRMNVRLDNLQNHLIQDNLKIPVIRQWGHPWWLLEAAPSAAFHLTETQLRQLHRRFGHPSVDRLARILEKIGEEFDSDTLKKLTKICHYCQLNSKAPGRFRFTVRDDHEFNHEVIVDIFYINNQPVLHIIDSATSFQAARFLDNKNQKAKDVWDTISVANSQA